MSAAKHVPCVVDFLDENEVVTLIAISNGKKLLWALPFEIFRQTIEKGDRVVAKHKTSKVVRIR